MDDSPGNGLQKDLPNEPLCVLAGARALVVVEELSEVQAVENQSHAGGRLLDEMGHEQQRVKEVQLTLRSVLLDVLLEEVFEVFLGDGLFRFGSEIHHKFNFGLEGAQRRLSFELARKEF